jgi:hypothetical protein
MISHSLAAPPHIDYGCANRNVRCTDIPRGELSSLRSQPAARYTEGSAVTGLATAHLEIDTLDQFLGLSAWHAPAPEFTEPVSREDRKVRQAEIRALLSQPAGGFLSDVPFALNKPLAIAVRMGRIPVEQYIVLNEICDALRGNENRCVVDFSDTAAWDKAIGIARGLVGDTSSGRTYLNQFSREQAVADAARRIEAQGFSVQINAYGVGFAQDVMTAICAKIEESVRQIGGQAIVEAIFRIHRDQQRFYHGTLLFGRRVVQIPQPREPQIPWHFLYNLALKHFEAVPTKPRDQPTFIAMLELARDMAAVIDAETYTIFDGMTGIGHSRFHGALLDRVIYDEMFAFPQWQPEVAPELFCRLVDHVAADVASLPLATADEWKAFGRALLALSLEHDILLSRPNKCFNHGISAGLANRMFEALAVPAGALNRDYHTPLDTPVRNAPYSPVYRLTGAKYLVPPRALCARGLYETFYSRLRKSNVPDVENLMGNVLERLTEDAIARTGTPPDIAHKKYHLTSAPKGKNIFDIDAMCFGEKRIRMFECKKKALPNVARAGNTLAVAYDFVAGFLTPVLQTIHHEIQLRDPKGLTISDGRTFALEGRHVQRYAITMTDHGSMQDGPFLRNMLIALWGVTLSSADPTNDGAAEAINRKLREMEDGVTAIASASGETIDVVLRGFAHNNGWFSIDQLYFFCGRTSDIQTAFGFLGSTTFGTGDVMNEYAIGDQKGFLAAAKKPQ